MRNSDKYNTNISFACAKFFKLIIIYILYIKQVDVEPLDAYLHKTDHPSENPKTLLTYSASVDNISSLGVKRFLHFGIPRVKTIKKRTSKVSDDSFHGSQILDKGQANTWKSKSLFSHKTVSSKKSKVQRQESVRDDVRASAVTTTMPSADGVDPDMHVFIPDIPYHEPEPDYGSNNQESSSPDPESPGPGSSFDNITSPGTSYAGNESSSCESEPEECPYVTRQKQAELFASNAVKKRMSTISRTYSTLDALDPVYIKSTEVKHKLKKGSKKDKEPSKPTGSWKSFDSSVTSAKSTQTKSKKSSFFNLFRKTGDVISKLQSGKKSKSLYAKSSDIKGSKLQDIKEEENNNTGDNNHVPEKPPDSYDDREDQGNHVIYARPEDIRERKVYSKSLKKDPIYVKNIDLRQGNADMFRPMYPDTRHPSVLGDPRYVSTGDIRASATKPKWPYFSRDSRTSEHTRTGDLRHYAPGAGIGGSMDLYAAGLVERMEFTREPRRIGFRRNEENHGRSQSHVYDNWGFH